MTCERDYGRIRRKQNKLKNDYIKKFLIMFTNISFSLFCFHRLRGFPFWSKSAHMMLHCNGSWCSINIYRQQYFAFINTDELLTPCHQRNFNSSTSRLSSLVSLQQFSRFVPSLTSMFEQIFRLFQSGSNRCLIHVTVFICLWAFLPHAQFVMCYFNRLSGRSETHWFPCVDLSFDICLIFIKNFLEHMKNLKRWYWFECNMLIKIAYRLSK